MAGWRKWLGNLDTHMPKLVTELQITPARLANIPGWCASPTAGMDADNSSPASAHCENLCASAPIRG